METLLVNLDRLFLAIPFFAILVLSLLLGKLLYARTSSYQVDAELTERDNPAFGVHFALYLLGVMIAVGGGLHRSGGQDLLGTPQFTLEQYTAALQEEREKWDVNGDKVIDPGELLAFTRDFDERRAAERRSAGVALTGVGILVGFAVLCMALMRLSIWVNAKFLLREFCIYKEMISDRNAGTGFVVGGACVATGLIINGSLSVKVVGDSLTEWLVWAVLGTLFFFVIGQLLLLAGGWVFRKIARFDVHHTIEHDDNLAAGIAYGGFLVALGIIVRASLVNATPDLVAELLTTVIYSAVGLALLTGMRVLLDRLLLPSSPLAREVAQDKNPAAGCVAAACFISIALAFSFAVVS